MNRKWQICIKTIVNQELIINLSSNGNLLGSFFSIFSGRKHLNERIMRMSKGIVDASKIISMFLLTCYMIRCWYIGVMFRKKIHICNFFFLILLLDMLVITLHISFDMKHWKGMFSRLPSYNMFSFLNQYVINCTRAVLTSKWTWYRIYI